MAINQLIAAGIQQPRFESPLNMMAQFAQLQQAQQANALNQMRMQQMERQLAEEEALRMGVQRLGPDPSTIDVARLLMQSPKTLQEGAGMFQTAKERERFSQMFPQFAGGAPGTAAPLATLPARGAPAPTMGAAPMPAMGAAPAEGAAMPPAAGAGMPGAGGRSIRDPDAIRRDMMMLAQFDKDPRAAALRKTLELELAEAIKTHTVGGSLVTAGGRVMYTAPNELTRLEEEVSDLVSKGVAMTDPRIVNRQAKIAKLVSHPTAAQMQVNTFTPASEQAQADFMRASSKAYETLRFAPQTLQSIEEAKALIPQARGFMGTGGEPLLAVASFLKSRLGIGVNTEGITSAEQLRSLLFQGVLDNLRSIDAQPTQQQQIALQQAIGRIGSDPDALPRILDVYGDRIRRRVDLYNKEVQSAEQRGVRFPYDPVIQLPEIGAAQAPARGRTPEPEAPARAAPVSDLTADELRRLKPTQSLVGRDRQAYEAAIAAPGNPDAEAVLRQLRQRKLIQ
jgi:hypothetical protein